MTRNRTTQRGPDLTDAPAAMESRESKTYACAASRK
jgi:hypothetical protein